MRTSAWLLLVLAGVVACGDDAGGAHDAAPSDGSPIDARIDAPTDAAEPAVGPVSGTRLHAGFLRGSDGSSLFTGMRDSERGDVRCSPQVADDGMTRCLPSDTLVASRFADAACTQPVAAYLRQCDPAPRYAATRSTVDCVERVTIHELGAPMQPASLFRRNNAGACVAAAVDPTQDYLLVGDLVPASAFVAMTREVTATASALETVYQVGSDGSRVPVSAWDEANEASCVAWNTADGLRCGPTDPGDISPTTLFSDSACTMRVAATPETCAPELVATYEVDTEELCAPPFGRFFRTGAVFDPTLAELYLSQFGGECTATTPSPTTDYRPLTDEIVPSALVPMSPAAQPSSRLQVKLWASADGYVDRGLTGVADVYDPTLAATCFPTLASDGTTRCAPQGELAFPYFSDATCTTPIDLVGVFNFGDPCAPPLPAYARIEGLDACTAGVRIFHLGTAYTDPVYFDLGAGCEQDLTPPDVLTYYALGAEVPPTGMVEMTQVIDGE